jgi:hypothetical protein
MVSYGYPRRLVTRSDFHAFMVDYCVGPFVLRKSGLQELTIALRRKPNPYDLTMLNMKLSTLSLVTMVVKLRFGWRAYWWNRFRGASKPPPPHYCSTCRYTAVHSDHEPCTSCWPLDQGKPLWQPASWWRRFLERVR